MQVEFHGRYSLERLGGLNSYMQTASLCRVMSVAFLSSFPCLVLAILVEAVPLAAPEDGVRANWVFLIRFGFVTGLMVGSMVFQMGQNVPALIVKTRHIITIAVLSAGTAVITLYAVASATVFPVPFTMLLASPPSIVMYGICFAIFWGAQFKADPSIQKEMEQQTTVLNCQISLTLIYPMYISGFTFFTGAYQTIFVVVLPIIKLIAKNWVSRALAGHNDFKPEAVIFNVEVFNALYISNALQVASTQASTVTIMAVDLLHFWLSMYDVVEILKQVKVLTNKIPEGNPIGKDNFLQNEQALFIRESARVLFITEYIVLVEYVEVVLPLVYCAHHVIVYNLHNRAYYPALAGISSSELTTTISHVLVYSSLELASLIMAMMLLKRSLGFLPIRQLSFVLENQAGIIQAKLLILFIYVMQISLVHIGADFSFKFAWLHDSKPSE
ncbi:hypothetical protein PI124_g14767 [Phytophthora idaei]|nr:hypothetical protein PI124_g14767 [Phytophthora idaei]